MALRLLPVQIRIGSGPALSGSGLVVRARRFIDAPEEKFARRFERIRESTGSSFTE